LVVTIWDEKEDLRSGLPSCFVKKSSDGNTQKGRVDKGYTQEVIFLREHQVGIDPRSTGFPGVVHNKFEVRGQKGQRKLGSLSEVCTRPNWWFCVQGRGKPTRNREKEWE